MAGPASGTSQKIPITTKSEEARREYLAGRTLVENLRNTDSINHFRKAVALDPTFALAHLALSNAAPTATEFQSERALAVKYLDKSSEGEQLLIQAVEEPAERGHQQHEPVVARQLAEPRSRDGGQRVGARGQGLFLRHEIGREQARRVGTRGATGWL